MPITLELSGILILGLTLVIQSVGVVWWASKMTQTLSQHSEDLKTLFKLTVDLKDTVNKNEEAALNREIERLNVENERLREAAHKIKGV